MILLGITGGIGAGKTVVSDMLRAKGIPVYDADTEAKRLMITHSYLRSELKKIFGDKIFLANGLLDRQRMASAIFSDGTLLARVNGCVHPVVAEDFCRWAGCSASPVVAVESAILFESHLSDKMDKVLTVSAPKQVRVRRVMQRNGITQQQVEARISNQMDDEVRRRMSDFVIDNDGEQAVLPQLNQILEKLKASFC